MGGASPQTSRPSPSPSGRTKPPSSPPHATVATLLLDGQYPAWRRVIPHEFATRLTCERQTLRKALDRLSIVAGHHPTIVCTFEAHRLTLRTDAGQAQGEEVVDITATGALPITMSFAGALLTTAVGIGRHATLQWDIGGYNLPSTFRDDNEPEAVHIALPLRSVAPASEPAAQRRPPLVTVPRPAPPPPTFARRQARRCGHVAGAALLCLTAGSTNALPWSVLAWLAGGALTVWAFRQEAGWRRRPRRASR